MSEESKECEVQTVKLELIWCVDEVIASSVITYFIYNNLWKS